MEQNQVTCNFFAILQDETIRKINLTQNIVNVIQNVFVNNSTIVFNDDIEEIKFDGNYVIQEDEVLYVELDLPDTIKVASNNAIGLEGLNLLTDKVKTIFWTENDTYYFQNFDNRKLLKNKNVIFYHY